MLDPRTNLAKRGKHDSDTGLYLTTEEMIAPHHYNDSMNKNSRKEENFFELNAKSCVAKFLQNLQVFHTRKEEQLYIELENNEIKKTEYKNKRIL